MREAFDLESHLEDFHHDSQLETARDDHHRQQALRARAQVTLDCEVDVVNRFEGLADRCCLSCCPLGVVLIHAEIVLQLGYHHHRDQAVLRVLLGSPQELAPPDQRIRIAYWQRGKAYQVLAYLHNAPKLGFGLFV